MPDENQSQTDSVRGNIQRIREITRDVSKLNGKIHSSTPRRQQSRSDERAETRKKA